MKTYTQCNLKRQEKCKYSCFLLFGEAEAAFLLYTPVFVSLAAFASRFKRMNCAVLI